MREAYWPGTDGGPVAGLLGGLDAIVGENGADRAGRDFEHVLQGLPSGAPVGLFNALGHGKFARAVDSDKETELALGRLHVCDINVKEPDRIALSFWRPGLPPATSGRRGMPCRCRRRCSADRVSCAIVGCRV